MSDSNQDVTTAIGAIVAVLAVIAVSLRFYSRHVSRTGFQWDDWMCLVALSAVIVTDALVLAANDADPTGPEAASNIDPTHVFTPADVYFTKLNFIATVLYFTIAATTKLSILLLYRRLFWIDASFRRQVLFLIVVVVCFWIGTVVADLLSCIPLEWTWNNSHQDPRYCFNYNIYWLISGIIEAVIDILIILLPIRVVLNLQLNQSKKIAVMAVFLIGAFSIISGIVKVVLSYAPGNRNPHFGNTEVWTTVHCGTGIICACLPVCWPLFVLVFRNSVSSIRTARYSWKGWSSMNRSGSDRTSTQILVHENPVAPGDHELPVYYYPVSYRESIGR
ncbi:hypothetical protein GGS20DRAFT_442254 [Poronia punctata]|nr:hypothetical protein GGS20DRAFT_442254 [Poronia punctata]